MSREYPFNVVHGGREVDAEIAAGKHDSDLLNLFFVCRSQAPVKSGRTDKIAARLTKLGLPVPGPSDVPVSTNGPGARPNHVGLWAFLKNDDGEARIAAGEADKQLHELWELSRRHTPDRLGAVEARFVKLKKPIPTPAEAA